MSTFTVASLFAGIGGIERGLESAGHHVEYQCEIHDAARAVLTAHYPNCRRSTDISRVRGLPDVDLVAAGFPCQDLSQAGQTRGIKGERSSLVDHVGSWLHRL